MRIDTRSGAAGGGGNHNLLSSTHPDTSAGSVVQGDVLIGNASPLWARLAGSITATRKYLSALGTGAAAGVPSWREFDASDVLSGTLAVNRGGTALDSYATGDILYASAATTLARLALGSVGQVLEVGAGGAPQWATRPRPIGWSWDPAVDNERTWGWTPVPITILEVRAVFLGGSSPTGAFNIYHSTDRSDVSPNTVFTVNQNVDSTTTGNVLSPDDDDTIPADSWIWIVATSPSGSPDELAVTCEGALA